MDVISKNGSHSRGTGGWTATTRSLGRRRRKKDFESFDVSLSSRFALVFLSDTKGLKCVVFLQRYDSRNLKRTNLGQSFALVHSPVVVFEAGPPVWRLEQSLEGAGEVDEAVAHQEEHG